MLIERKWDAYNTRRYGAPWAARVTFKDGEVKPEYDFIGRFASSILAFEAQPGWIIAMGQKDHRGNNTSKDFYVIGDDGTLHETTEPQARVYLRQQIADPVPALKKATMALAEQYRVAAEHLDAQWVAAATEQAKDCRETAKRLFELAEGLPR